MNSRFHHWQTPTVFSICLDGLFLSFKTQFSHRFPFDSYLAPELTMPPYNVMPSSLVPYMGVY